MCLCHQAVGYNLVAVTEQRCPATGKVTVGLAAALARRHRIKWLIHLRDQGLSKGYEHPTNTPHGVWYSLPLQGKGRLAQECRGAVLRENFRLSLRHGR